MSLPCCNQHHHTLNSWCQTLTSIMCQIQLLTQQYSISLNSKPTNPTLTLLFISHVLTFQETFSYHNCVHVSCFSQFSSVESKVCRMHGNRFLPNCLSGPAVHSPPGCTPVLYDFYPKVAAPCAWAPSCLHSSSPLSPPDYTALSTATDPHHAPASCVQSHSGSCTWGRQRTTRFLHTFFSVGALAEKIQHCSTDVHEWNSKIFYIIDMLIY